MVPTISTLQQFIASCDHPASATDTTASKTAGGPSCALHGTDSSNSRTAVAAVATTSSNTSSNTSSSAGSSSDTNCAHFADNSTNSTAGVAAAAAAAAWEEGGELDLDMEVTSANDTMGAEDRHCERKRAGMEYPDSSQRLVYMSKYVVAVHLQQRTGSGGNSASEDNAQQQQVVHDLGVAAFGRENEETQLVSP